MNTHEPLWRHVVGEVLRRERLAQRRTLKDVADEARISMPYLSELERGRKEASSEVLAAAARALGLSLVELLALTQDELVRLGHARTVRIRSRVDAPRQPMDATKPVAAVLRRGLAAEAGRKGQPSDGAATSEIYQAGSVAARQQISRLRRNGLALAA